MREVPLQQLDTVPLVDDHADRKPGAAVRGQPLVVEPHRPRDIVTVGPRPPEVNQPRPLAQPEQVWSVTIRRLLESKRPVDKVEST